MKYYSEKISESGCIAIDDTILVKNYPSAAGSKMLEGFKPLFSAEVVTRLEHKSYTISGKSCTGEFGLDLVGEFSRNSEETTSLKGAAAELVASQKVKAALAVDLNGAPRRAAAISGVDFLKPTYGTVSRYGVISCAASGEQVGIYAQNANDIQEIISVIAGHDEKDGTCLPNKTYDYSSNINISKKRVGLVKELIEKADSDVKKHIDNFVKSLKANDVIVEEISCDFFDVANTAWQILMCAETCNNLSRYDGVKFGHRTKHYKNIDELYVNSRTEGFNFLTKAIILYGSNVLSKDRYADFYDRSLKIRRVIFEKMNTLFHTYDALIIPACSKTEYEAYDIQYAFEKVFNESIFTAVANLTGVPALVSNGVQLVGKHFDESTLLSLANCVEKKGR